MVRKWDNIRVQLVGGRGSNVDYDMGNLYSVKVSYATNFKTVTAFIPPVLFFVPMKPLLDGASHAERLVYGIITDKSCKNGYKLNWTPWFWT